MDRDRIVTAAAAPSALPEAQPFDSRHIAVGDGHEVYVEQVGRPDGIPAVFLHGGPGSGAQPAHRGLFDRERFRAVLTDQRGAGRSRPKGSRVANTTQHLVADLELIRETLGIHRWLVVGGSWGATLALAYAEAHPERVAGIVLRAVFLGTRAELEWAFIDGPRRLRPDLYGDFVSLLDDAERADPLNAYYRRILDPDPLVHGPAAWAWHDTERVLSQAAPASPRVTVRQPRQAAAGVLPSTPFMEAHYFAQDCFMQPDQLLAHAGRLAGIPGRIVQGRYDLLCPPSTSAALAAAWPDATVRIVENAGHAMSEPGITEAVVAAIDDLADQTGGTDGR